MIAYSYRSKNAANSRLIGAAPDMLEAAERLLDWLRAFWPDEPLFSMDNKNLTGVPVLRLEAAIRKARGEQ